ncbi:hypothetical protein CIB95_00450 [Lottiidibacillus patelloidae]|uniref:Probable membrane transporter protein n=1 Tax=Lottiidibacillus patelloidae TaxID=2670334 RepID=A0A263BWJ5_9BACI|nr:sulfite exporter TauE/SafE family protein [Lottiidibacillus patelloidae]OZM58084.1 hypothetical protein CIB95_00450 [Lottiidibacillus patelloidae]
MQWDLVFVFLIVLIGSIMQGASGFGFGLVVMGILPLMLTVKDSTLLTMSLVVVMTITILSKLYKYIELKQMLIIVVSALFARIFSFLFLNTYGEMDFLKQWLGIFLIVLVLYLLFSKKKKEKPVITTPLLPIILGLLGGFIGGIFAVGGPFFVFYFLMIYEDKRKYNANLQASFLITSLFTIIIHGANGDFDSSFILYFLCGLVSVFIGTYIGLKLFEKLSNEIIKKIAMMMVTVAAIILIFIG